MNDELFPDLEEKMLKYTVVHTPKKTRVAGKRALRGTATWFLLSVLTDKTVEKHKVGFPSTVVSGLGRHLFC